jgi:hypothetical protein
VLAPVQEAQRGCLSIYPATFGKDENRTEGSTRRAAGRPERDCPQGKSRSDKAVGRRPQPILPPPPPYKALHCRALCFLVQGAHGEAPSQAPQPVPEKAVTQSHSSSPMDCGISRS